MALKPTDMPDREDVFLREVDEDFRRDQWTSLWQRYGRLGLGLLGAGLIALAGYLYWQDRQADQVAVQADRYTEALAKLETGDRAAALTTLQELSTAGSPGFRSLARLDLAANHQRDAKPEEALKIYQAMAADSKLPQVFRDYASVRAVMLQYDRLPAAQAIEQLKPLAQDGMPWFGTAGELLALSYLEANQPALAKPLFEALAGSDTVPPTTRQRAAAMVDMLGGPSTAKPAAPATPAAPSAAAPVQGETK